MRHSTAKSSFPAGNPIANALVVVAGVLAIAASVVLGFFAFVALSAVILIAASIIGIRVWWLKRKIHDSPELSRTAGRTAPDSVIEGEYRVIGEDRDET